LGVLSGAPARAAEGWPGAFETDAPLIAMVEVRFSRGAQISSDGNVQLDDAIARVGRAGYWLVEGASDSGGAAAKQEANARAEAVRVYLIERDVLPERIVTAPLPDAHGPKARVRTFSAPPSKIDLSFAPGDATLDENARRALDFIFASLEGRDVPLVIRAFAAPVTGGDALKLALARAIAVRSYLLGKSMPGYLLEITAAVAEKSPESERVELSPVVLNPTAAIGQ
jgi:outer membrane protein OmpA-like peptidoglycan-associated protein